jgi:polyhydroxyalkanoate synthesis regulator phasin
MENSNLAIWDDVQVTDPEYTRNFKGTGGFSGTAINATYLIKRATEIFGPVGSGWGYEILDEDFVHGSTIYIERDKKLLETKDHYIIHKLRLRVWFKKGEVTGEAIHFGQTTFVGKNKYGPFTDEEAPKKSLTDALTKALSMIGFGADVHLGHYDDNKYVEGLMAHGKLSKQKARELYSQLSGEMRKCNSKEELEDWSSGRKGEIDTLPPDWTNQLRDEYKAMALAVDPKPDEEITTTEEPQSYPADDATDEDAFYRANANPLDDGGDEIPFDVHGSVQDDGSANLSDDPGELPEFLDRRKQEEADAS